MRIQNRFGIKYCHLCGQEFTDRTQVTKDHLVARRDGGSNERSNLRLAHAICNSERGHMPIDLYRMFALIKRKHPHHVIDAFVRRRESREKRQLGLFGMCLKSDE